MDENCNSCYYSRVGIRDGHNVLECRFNAPKWNSGVGTGREDGLFPMVTDEVWCKEYYNSDKMMEFLCWGQNDES
jgi:hypothetical protein